MNATKNILYDKDGNEFYPKTVTSNVYDESGNRLDNVLNKEWERITIISHSTNQGWSSVYTATKKYSEIKVVIMSQYYAGNFNFIYSHKVNSENQTYDVPLGFNLAITSLGTRFGRYVYYDDLGLNVGDTIQLYKSVSIDTTSTIEIYAR